MRYIISFFIKNPVAVNVLMVLILAFGVFGFRSQKSTFFPQTSVRNISIQLVYPGASPEEIEEGVVAKIEENLRGMSGISRVTSVSQENAASITVEKTDDFDIDLLVQDVKNAVDQIPSFPVDLEPPVVYKGENLNRAISFGISGDADLITLKKIARRAENELLSIEGISKVVLDGFPEEEIEIAVRESDMRAYKLTFSDVSNAVRSANLELTGGTIKEAEDELLIRARSKSYFANELNNIVVSSTEDGRVVRLYDIAEVRDKWADSPERTQINQQNAVTVTVSNTDEEDFLYVVAKTKEYIEDFNAQNENFKMTITQDASISMIQRIGILTYNGVIGFILVLILLALFLNIRLAFWVALALPICFMGMYMVGPAFGLTTNIISLFAMILVIGILVDDGIVIGENIYQHYEKGKSRIQAAIDGTMEVLPAVFAAILTTILAFLTFFFLEGREAEIFSEMGLVVAITLAFSLVEAAFILPGHVAHSLKKVQVKNVLERTMDKGMNFFKERLYGPILKFCIDFPMLIVSLSIGLLLISTWGLVGSGNLKFTFFPDIDGNDINITLKMPAGTRENITDKYLNYLEEKVWEVNDSLRNAREDGLDVVEFVSKKIGPTTYDGNLAIKLLDGETRNLEADVIGAIFQKKVGPIYEAEELTYNASRFFGKAVSLSVMGSDLEQLELAVKEIKQEMNRMTTIRNQTDSNKEGLRELNINLREKARYLGISLQDVVSQVRQGFFGAEVQRLQRGRDEVCVWVRFDEQDRSSIGNLEEMRIRLADGREFPLLELATISEKRGVIKINRIDGKREIRLEADLANKKIAATEVLADIQDNILPSIKAKYPDIQTRFEGQADRGRQLQESARLVLPIVLILMICIIILTFKSVGQTMAVFITLPFGFIGVAWGHLLHGMNLSILTMMGLLALLGVIINDSVVLVSAFNNKIQEGMRFKDAVYQAAQSRFRAIILTSLTTIAGLYPLILETASTAQWLKPMAVSIAYGLLFGTFIVLVALPALLVILNWYRRAVVYLWEGVWPEPNTVEPHREKRKGHFALYAIMGFVILILFYLISKFPQLFS